ncbi:MAG: hypothetical protein WAU32_15295 [Thermoanaerobaculia bacterium]
MMPALIPPTYDDAVLVLRLYELRREEKLRAAREWFRTAFFPRSYDDVRTVTSTNGPENTHFRMVTGYWDMACSIVAHGVLHPDLFFESGGEAIFVWAKLSPFIADLRRDQQNPRVLANVEKAIAMSPGAAERVAVIRGRLEAMRERYRK